MTTPIASRLKKPTRGDFDVIYWTVLLAILGLGAWSLSRLWFAPQDDPAMTLLRWRFAGGCLVMAGVWYGARRLVRAVTG